MFEEEEQNSWRLFATAMREYDKTSTEIKALRVHIAFKNWAALFTPETTPADLAILRSRLRGF